MHHGNSKRGKNNMTQAGDNDEPQRQKRKKSQQQQGEDTTKQSEMLSEKERERIRRVYE